MIATLAWKDYREQRGLWLAIAALAVLGSVGLVLNARGGLAHAHDDSLVRDMLTGFLFALMVAQGVVAGAQLLAGEKEGGTLPYLDVLPGWRYPLWLTKAAVGASMTLAQALVLFALILGLGVGDWEYLPSLIVIGLLSFCGGMFGGAICGHVFPAILTGIAIGVVCGFQLPALLASITFGGNTLGILYFFPIFQDAAIIVSMLGFLYVSKKKFCAADERRRLTWTLPRELWKPGPNSRRTLLWLAHRQGRWLIWPGLLLSCIAGLVARENAISVIAGGTLLIGILCGIAVFGSERSSEQGSFLGAQRFPPGRIWLVKTLFWAVSAGVMAMSLVGLALLWFGPYSLANILRRPGFLLFCSLWIVHGFCVGVFCALLSRKLVVSGFLAAAASIIILGLWLPSLLFGGVPLWRLLAIPLVLLVAARLSVWTWFSGRLYTRRHLLGLAGTGLLVVLWLGGNLWYRAAEIPEIGEPFDVRAFQEKLEVAARNESGLLIRQAATAMVAHRGKFPDDQMGKITEVAQNGWRSVDIKVDRWLHAMFVGEWAADIRRAAKLPLGVVENPNTVPLAPGKIVLPSIDRYRVMGELFMARALQCKARGDDQAALENLETVFALGRHYRSFATRRWWYMTADKDALHGLSQWLRSAAPEADFLRTALRILQTHEKEMPEATVSIEADYVMLRRDPSIFWYDGSADSKSLGLLKAASETPWEHERQVRFLNAYFQGQLRLAKLTPGEWLEKTLHRWAANDLVARRSGLALADGGWTPERWEKLINDTTRLLWPSLSNWRGYDPGFFVGQHDLLRDLRLCQAQIAVMLYQAEEGHPPARLEDLVPRYLSKVPINPFENRPFSYKVSRGEKIIGYMFMDDHASTEWLRPGQGVLWYEGQNALPRYAPVPASDTD